MRKALAFFILVLAPAVFSRCVSAGSSESSSDSGIYGKWRLRTLYSGDVAQSVCDVILNIGQDENGIYVSGESGVNIFSGTMNKSGNSVYNGNGFAVTRMAGPGDAAEFERLYLSMFEGRTEFSAESGGGHKILAVRNRRNGISAEYSQENSPDSGGEASDSALTRKIFAAD